MTRQEEVHKAIENTKLTDEEEFAALWEAKTAKMHRLSHGEAFRARHKQVEVDIEESENTIEIIKQALKPGELEYLNKKDIDERTKQLLK